MLTLSRNDDYINYTRRKGQDADNNVMIIDTDRHAKYAGIFREHKLKEERRPEMVDGIDERKKFNAKTQEMIDYIDMKNKQMEYSQYSEKTIRNSRDFAIFYSSLQDMLPLGVEGRDVIIQNEITRYINQRMDGLTTPGDIKNENMKQLKEKAEKITSSYEDMKRKEMRENQPTEQLNFSRRNPRIIEEVEEGQRQTNERMNMEHFGIREEQTEIIKVLRSLETLDKTSSLTKSKVKDSLRVLSKATGISQKSLNEDFLRKMDDTVPTLSLTAYISTILRNHQRTTAEMMRTFRGVENA